MKYLFYIIIVLLLCSFDTKPKISLVIGFDNGCNGKNIVRFTDFSGKYVLCPSQGDHAPICYLTKKGEKKLRSIAKRTKLIYIVNPSEFKMLIDFKIFTNLETLVFCGDDSDVKFDKIPEEALKIVSLKTIYLQYVDPNNKIEEQVKATRPDIKIIRTKPFIDEPKDFCKLME